MTNNKAMPSEAPAWNVEDNADRVDASYAPTDLSGGRHEDVPDEACESEHFAAEVADDEEFPSGPSRALWEGDQGFLTLQQRRTWVALLKNRYISPATPGGVWQTLVQDETPFHSRLNDMFLELEIDRHHQVAFKVQARPEADNKTFPTVLHDQPWSREETILLVYLRMRFRSGYGGSEKVFVDVEEVIDHVQSYRPPTDLARSRGKSTTRSAIETVRKAGILVGKEGAQRFQISPIVEVLLTDARIEQLLTWLIDQNGELDPDDNPTSAGSVGDAHEAPNGQTPPLDLFPDDGDTP